jgi:hypothetical protein
VDAAHQLPEVRLAGRFGGGPHESLEVVGGFGQGDFDDLSPGFSSKDV